jgi:hypothetical protein
MTTRTDLTALVSNLPPILPDLLNGATQIYASGTLVEELNEVVSVLGRLRFGRRVAVLPTDSLPAGCALGMKGCEVVLLITPDQHKVAKSSPPFPGDRHGVGPDDMVARVGSVVNRCDPLQIRRTSIEAAQRRQGDLDPKLQREPRRGASSAR